MRTTTLGIAVVVSALALTAFMADATVFTTDTIIGSGTTNYDGQNLVVDGCTVTIDGSHIFSDVLITDNGVMTHSYSANGLVTNIITVTGERQKLSRTNGTSLNLPNVLTNTIVLTAVANGRPYTNGIDYTVGNDGSGFTQIALAANSTLPDGIIVYLNYQALASPVSAGLNLTVSNNIVVEAGSSILADGRGFGGGAGPGAGGSSTSEVSEYGFVLEYVSGGGGAYGGQGGASLGETNGGVFYGQILSPTNSGGGGGAGDGFGGAGGGVINLTASGLILVDGQITANGGNGTNSGAGGGSGGGIRLSVPYLSGAGTISANGGSGEDAFGGGGSGGRIAIFSASNDFTGTLAAHGGTGANTGGAGTIYNNISSTGNTYGQVTVDNGSLPGTNTPVVASEPFDLNVSGGATASIVNAIRIGSLSISSNAWLSLTSLSIYTNLNVTGNATISAGGGIVADSMGYPGGQGPGAGGYYLTNNNYIGLGGTYGGSGGGSGNSNGYGTISQPNQPGSGGGRGNGQSPNYFGGAGGGLIYLTVTGNVQLNGTISANGASGTNENSGGGSGGGIYLTANSLAGSGTIRANGGNGESLIGDGGGGGRIALILETTNQFAGIISAYGGLGGINGGAGTIYIQSSYSGVPLVLADNGGKSGGNTALQGISGVYDLTVTNGATIFPGLLGGITIRNLMVGSNSFLLPVLPQLGLQSVIINLEGSATIQAGGGIVLDGGGYGNGNNGNAPGGTTTINGIQSGGGGGHGGFGGISASGATGGISYDSITQPGEAGSAGGNGSGNAPYDFGGVGGGSLNLSVKGTLLLNGIISANGLPGLGQGSGGGAGGSITISGLTLSGTGIISANGGNGESVLGGGGGGGRIAITMQTNNFTGAISAYGGQGFASGGAGTIYTKLSSSQYSQIVLDNHGSTVTNTLSLGFGSGTDIILTNGASLLIAGATSTLHNITIGANSFLTLTNVPTALNVANLTVSAGGGIIGDGRGVQAGITSQGSGASYSSNGIVTGGGGANGGTGGTSALGASGGTAVGSVVTPVSLGGSGGNGMGASPYNFGGAGGGALQINASGNISINGKISANGNPGVGQASGGGGGGSIYIAAGGLFGNGIISANGGAGEPSLGGGGGGGGGRVVISGLTNQYTGAVSAYGGAGGIAGGAGTIYTPNFTNQIGRLLVDNGGLRGTNTPLPILNASSDLIVTNAAILTISANQNLNSLLIASNSLLTVTNQTTPLILIIRSNAMIQASGALTVDGAGYSGNLMGPGPGNTIFVNAISGYTGGGGGYGGNGGASFGGAAGGIEYGNLSNPTTPGSAGGHGTGNSPQFYGGNGGGTIQLTVNGTLQVAGRISANGLAGTGEGSGGGAGGSVYLSLGTLSGSGVIAANGGAAESALGGGGGGGRIAINVISNQFAGIVSAYGGAGFAAGGAGTVYFGAEENKMAQVIVDGGGATGNNSYTILPALNEVGLTITGGAKAVGNLNSQIFNSLTLTSNSFLLAGTNGPTTLNCIVAGNATIQAGSGIIADGCGYAGNQGTGHGVAETSQFGDLTATGGSYGGEGGLGDFSANNGIAYGSILSPTVVGSGGGASVTTLAQSAGGGALNLTVTGTLNLNGTISANGLTATNDGDGGGSGGSVLLTVETLTGNGGISANGGSAPDFSGGGGGGRIAVYFTTNQFTGAITAYGGQGFDNGGAGTIYTKAAKSNYGSLLVDNGGLSGNDTPITAPQIFNLTVSGSAVAETPSTIDPTLVLNSLLVQSNGIITTAAASENISLVILSNAVVATNGFITADGTGYNGSVSDGPGSGIFTPQGDETGTGGGGGYGGMGGASAFGVAGGMTYGSSQQPVDWGSRGGLPTTGFATISQGGGGIRMEVAGTLTISGSVSANGNAAEVPGTGGGGGGSVWLSADALAGSGNISANGGSGSTSGGGGGGGRIALYYLTNNFAGAVAALGGTGASPGQNGTVLLTNLPTPMVIGQSPTGAVSGPISSLTITFNSKINQSLAPNISVMAPDGTAVAASVISANEYPQDFSTFTISFPQQIEVGNYTIQINPTVEDIFGLADSGTYTGNFAIAQPLIFGSIADTNGNPVPGVLVEASGTTNSVTTDINGNYSVSVPTNWTGTLTPTEPGLAFSPVSLSYTNLTVSITNQNFLESPTAPLTLQAIPQSAGLSLNWFGVSGVNYQVQYSTDLVNWFPLGSPIIGSNAPISMTEPAGSSPQMFYRFGSQ